MKKYRTIRCDICSKVFEPTGAKQKTCSVECLNTKNARKQKVKIRTFLDKFDLHHESYKKILRLVKNRKYLVKDERTIPYVDSPTGKAFIGISKKPLQPAKEGGFGYQGVLIQTDNRQFIQCHLCGKWLRKLSGGHLDKKHKITKIDYQNKFGLYAGNNLVSDASSYKYETSARKRNDLDQNKNISLLKKHQKLVTHNSHKSVARKTEHENRYSICEAQLNFRLLTWIKQFKDLPSRSTKGDAGKVCKAIYRRYGSLNAGFKHYGVPVRYKQGTNVELVAQDSHQLFFNYNNKGYDKEKLFSWMVEHSPVLQEKTFTINE